ncbi:MAG TPA: glycosyltransferase [Solirubrobacteraceae bacterium]|nr:glycosyltransferase [Solirubrobacteraceae bacterium]
MRVLIFHGYLLDGTGSNVYNARLADALAGLGHDVHLLCQERHPHDHAFVDAAGDWDAGALRVSELRSAPAHSAGGTARGRCTVYRPNIGDLLPVYVADRYEGIEARAFPDCSEEEIARYIAANVAAVAELLDRVRPQLALANHLVMGPVILARALHGAVPYAVKVHGSALEYVVKPHPQRFLASAREGLAGARAVLVGSRHTAASLWRALGDDGSLERRTRLGPPGVDVQRFAARPPQAAAAGVADLAVRLRGSAGAQAQAAAQEPARADSAFARDELEAAVALEQLRPQRDALVAFVGKLIVSKGVDLLIAAWPLVLQRVPQAQLVLVGFGAYRGALQRLLGALADADMVAARQIALAGRSLEVAPEAQVASGSPAAPADPDVCAPAEAGEAARPLAHLLAFLDSLRGGERERYLQAAAAMREGVFFTGRLEHSELAQLLPACQAVVVPSTFPESFGMVAVEAAACAALPISAAHSGLAEVSQELACQVPEQARAWLSFPIDDHAVRALAGCLEGWLTAPGALRAQTRTGLVDVVRERWSWDGVARGVIAAASGQLDELREP